MANEVQPNLNVNKITHNKTFQKTVKPSFAEKSIKGLILLKMTK